MSKKLFLLVLCLLLFATVQLPPSGRAAGDFTISAVTPITIDNGITGTTSVTLTPSGGFTGAVTLSSTVSPSSGLALVDCNPNPVQISATNAVSTTCRYRASVAGTYTITVTGTSGTLVHSTTVQATVVAFSLRVSGRISFNEGSSTSTQIELRSIQFAGTVTISNTVTPTTGLTVVCPASLSVTVTGVTQVAIGTCTFSSRSNNVYNVTITASSTNVPTVTTFSIVTVLGYTISASPSFFVRQNWGSTVTTTIVVSSVNTFSGRVTMWITPVNGFTASFNPPTVNLRGSANVTVLTLSVLQPPPGQNVILVNANSTVSGGIMIASATVNVEIIGEVCLADPSASLPSPCPTAPAIFTGPVAPTRTQLRVGVFVQGSSPLSSFEITLLADHTILLPYDVDLTGTILQNSPTVLVKCIGIVPKTGSACPATDTADTIHIAVTALGLTEKPSSGLLFTAIYNITSSASSVPVGFQTGCTSTSVLPNICVRIGDGTRDSVPETAQSGIFTNQALFSIDASPNQLLISRGSSGSSFLTLTSLNSFSGTVNLNAVVSPAIIGAPTASLSPAAVTVTQSTPGNSLLTISMGTIATGNFNVTIIGNSGLISNSVAIRVVGPDFVLAANPNTLLANASIPQQSKILALSVRGFSGTINLATSPPTGVTATLDRASVIVPTDGGAGANLTAAAGFQGSYGINVTGTSGTIGRYVLVQINIVGFSLSSSTNYLTIAQGNQQSSIITTSATPGFSGTITLVLSVGFVTGNSTSSPTQGLAAVCSPTTITLDATTSSSKSNCTFNAVTAGNYTVTIMGTNGQSSRGVSVSVTVIGPDFSLANVPNVLIVAIGSTSSNTFQVTRIVNYNGSVTLSATPSSTGLKASLNSTSVSLSSTKVQATFLLTVSSDTTLSPGTYSLTLTGASSLGGSHSKLITVVATTTTSSSHDVAIYSVAASPTTVKQGDTLTITIIVLNLGRVAENTTVIATIGDQTVAQKNVTIPAGQNRTVVLQWTINQFNPGSYIVGAKVLQVPGQTNTAHNVLRSATPLTITSSSSGILDSQYTLPILGIIAVIAAGLVGVFYFFSRKRTTKVV